MSSSRPEPVLQGWSLLALRVGIVLGVLWLLLQTFRLLVVPIVGVFIGVIIAVLMTPGVDALERRRVPRSLAAFVVLLAALGLATGVGYILVQQFGSQGPELLESAGDATGAMASWLQDGPLGLSQADINRYVEQGTEQLQQNAGGLLAGVATGAIAVVEGLGALLLAVVVAYFVARDGRRMFAWFLDRVVRPRDRSLVEAVGSRGWTTLQRYTAGVAITGVANALGLGAVLLVLDVPLLVPIMVLEFLGAFFPVVGGLTAGAIAVGIAFVSNGPTDAIIVALAAVVVAQIEGNLLEPVVMARAVLVHPLVVLIALTVGGILAGIPGAAMAVPMVAVASAGGEEWRRHREMRGDTTLPAP